MRFVVDALLTRMAATRAMVWMPGENGLRLVGAREAPGAPDVSRIDTLPTDLTDVFGAAPVVIRTPADPDQPLLAVVAVVGERSAEDLQRDLDDAAAALSMANCSAEGVLEAISDQAAVLDGAGVIVRANRAWLDAPASHSIAVERSRVGTNYPSALAGQDSRSARIAADGIRSVLAGALPGFQSEYDITAAERSYSLQVDPLPRTGSFCRNC